MRLLTCLRRLFHDSNGQDLIEYALISTAVALAAYAGVTFVGTSLRDMDAAATSHTAFGAPCTVEDAFANISTTDTCGGIPNGGGGGGSTSGGGSSTTGGGSNGNGNGSGGSNGGSNGNGNGH